MHEQIIEASEHLRNCWDCGLIVQQPYAQRTMVPTIARWKRGTSSDPRTGLTGPRIISASVTLEPQNFMSPSGVHTATPGKGVLEPFNVSVILGSKYIPSCKSTMAVLQQSIGQSLCGSDEHFTPD
jgi:hypothetical protein